MHFCRHVKTPPNLVAFYIFANGALSNVLSHTKALLDYYLNSSLLLILYCDLKSFDLEFTYIYYILRQHSALIKVFENKLLVQYVYLMILKI